MIHYLINAIDLKKKILKKSPKWYERVKRYLGDSDKKAAPWNSIKKVFMILQRNKCVYCERIPGRHVIDFDVEHYRPKGRIRPWPGKIFNPDYPERYNYPMSLGEESEEGYELLETDFRNYAAACKQCNTIQKSNFFPIGQKRRFDSVEPADLKEEEPYLLFPIIESENDKPENLIGFEGVLPVAKIRSDRDYWRARITIDFFELDLREDLLEERADIITILWANHQTLDPGIADMKGNKMDARKSIARRTARRARHTNCADSFVQMCKNDSNRAGKHAELANEFLNALENGRKSKEVLTKNYVRDTNAISIYDH